MAPTIIPPSSPASRRGKSAASPTITISSDSDVLTVINVSSSSDDEEVTSRPMSAARRTTPPSSSVSVVRSPRASSNRGDEATSQQRRAARPSSPASPAVSVRSEATTIEPKKKKNKWCLKDERLILETMAFLRMGNHDDKVPEAPEVLRHLVSLRRRGVDVRQLSDKMYQLKKKFENTAAKAAANGGKLRRRTRYRDRVLYETSQAVWPQLRE